VINNIVDLQVLTPSNLRLALQQSQGCQLNQLCHHFNVSAQLIMPVLLFWLKKGKVISKKEPGGCHGCQKTCSKCPINLENPFYCWVEE
jgi:hypothetical protein